MSHGLACGAAAVVTLLLAGCVSTQQKAAWLHVQNERVLASQNVNRVRQPDPWIRIERTTLLRSGSRLAVSVRLKNLSRRPLNDLPILVGLRGGRKQTYLNRRPGLDYFRTHVALIPPRADETWVFTSSSRPPVAGRPFALVGAAANPPVTVAHTIPSVRVRVSHRGGRDGLRVEVTNLSDIPQADVPVYALSVLAGRTAAAGSARVAQLAGGATASARLRLVGRLSRGPLQLEVLPTQFQ